MIFSFIMSLNQKSNIFSPLLSNWIIEPLVYYRFLPHIHALGFNQSPFVVYHQSLNSAEYEIIRDSLANCWILNFPESVCSCSLLKQVILILPLFITGYIQYRFLSSLCCILPNVRVTVTDNLREILDQDFMIHYKCLNRLWLQGLVRRNRPQPSLVSLTRESPDMAIKQGCEII